MARAVQKPLEPNSVAQAQNCELIELIMSGEWSRVAVGKHARRVVPKCSNVAYSNLESWSQSKSEERGPKIEEKEERSMSNNNIKTKSKSTTSCGTWAFRILVIIMSTAAITAVALVKNPPADLDDMKLS